MIEFNARIKKCFHCSINGVPACANKKLLTDILRSEWGFEGYVISDMQAVQNVMTQHKYTNNTVDTAAVCVNAGMFCWNYLPACRARLNVGSFDLVHCLSNNIAKLFYCAGN
jgi:beta-glucosidase-like glycosyl hydrolase